MEVWFYIGVLHKRHGRIVAWVYDTYYKIISDEGITYFVYPEYIDYGTIVERDQSKPDLPIVKKRFNPFSDIRRNGYIRRAISKLVHKSKII